MNRIIALVFLITVIGCGSDINVPDGILPPPKMQHVMWDMIRADGYISSSTDSLIKKTGNRIELYSTVLSSYNLSRDEFRKNMQFYQSRPDLLKIVFDSLQQMALRDTATIIVKSPNVVKDTVKPAVDSLKRRKLSIERMRSLQKLKPA